MSLKEKIGKKVVFVGTCRRGSGNEVAMRDLAAAQWAICAFPAIGALMAVWLACLLRERGIRPLRALARSADMRELAFGTDPMSPDTDGDGLLDGWEAAHGLDPLVPSGDDGADADIDGDGLANIQEQRRGTDPHDADTDGDGLSDGQEVNVHGTRPTIADTDGDGLNDGEEINHGTDPLRADTDFDGLPDGWEET